MAAKVSRIFVNLPIKDVDASRAFFNKVGLEFNPEYSNEDALCMIVNESSYVMLLKESHFKTFINKDIADATKTTEVIVSLNVDTKENVDAMVKRALDAGATHSVYPADHGFMYIWGFQDLDGHLWELCYMAE